MIIGNILGYHMGNRDDFALWHSCAHVGLMIKIGHGRINQDNRCDHPSGIHEKLLC